MNLVALQFATTIDFEKNLNTLISLIEKTKQNDIVIAPELCLNGYAYNKLDQAVQITQKAIKVLLELSNNKTIITTLTTKNKLKYYNTLYIFHKNKIIHTQSKHHLFVLNDERKYFTKGDIKDIKIIDIDGLKIGSMICFELRFIDIWKKLQGADIIVVPSMWGLLRREHLNSLGKSLAILNQCFVIISNSSNKDMAKNSGIFSPFGNETIDDNLEVISSVFNKNEIKKLRRYMNVGINNNIKKDI